MADDLKLWGDIHPWNPLDPGRPCYTCGAPPAGTFRDGSPRYAMSCSHPPVLGRVIHVPNVSLTWTLGTQDIGHVERCATALKERADRKGYQDRWGGQALDDEGRLDANRVGFGGEVAFARIARLNWRCNAYGFGKADVGRYQVRTRRPANGELILHEWDSGPVVLMVGTPWTFRLVGWVPNATEFRRPEYVRDPGRRRPAWFVPQDHLADPWLLPEVDAQVQADLEAVR